MQHSEFKIGGISRCDGRLWRCTDIGTRTIVAIRIDRVEVGGSPALRRTLSGTEAEAEGWFRGPPYAVVESVFDESDIESCSPEPGSFGLNLGDAAKVRTAYAEILASAKAYAPQARIIGVSVQEMVGEGVEVIIGVNCDPQLGPVLLFGGGGVIAEVYNDVACDATRSRARKHRR
jgi:acetyltransferase